MFTSLSIKKYVCSSYNYMEHTIFLLLGTNLGDKSQNLATAMALIKDSIGTIRLKSSVYKTAAWGKTDQPDFYNIALEVVTAHAPLEVLQETQQIEKKMGREKKEHWGERVIDIDILLFEDIRINTPSLTIPHPELINRRFALVPLNEIAETLIHPIHHCSIAQLLQACKDPLPVERVV